ncbi:uncharacterized protein LOC126839859 [Adelges cooleyi]|uniref:uncharacterized protein LOC126839859 n=1 Tax=Adelges cooleyi TaxID=133065 RepID=UPI00217FABBA|nr:uncharacterized protein LOC126839859 [Adelges cooleyi]XP_050431235.1 uncharacterized protein LOC126839859 [Adelges cooleyi]
MKLRRSLVFLLLVLFQTQCSFGFIKPGKLFKTFFGLKNEQISTEPAILEGQIYDKTPVKIEYPLPEWKPVDQMAITIDEKPLVGENAKLTEDLFENTGQLNNVYTASTVTDDLTGKKQSVIDGVKNVVASTKAEISNKISAIASMFSKSPGVTVPDTETEYLSLGPTPIWEQIKSADGQIAKPKSYPGIQDQAFVQYQIPARVVPFQNMYYYPVPQQQPWPNYGPAVHTRWYPNIRYQTGVNSEIRPNLYLNSLLSAGERSPLPVKVPCDANAAPLKGLEAYPYGQDTKAPVPPNPELDDVWTQYKGESDSSKPFRGDIPLEESASGSKNDVSRPLGLYASEDLKKASSLQGESAEISNQEEDRLNKRTDLNPFSWLGNQPSQEETDFNVDIRTPLQKRPADNAIPVAEIVEITTAEANANSSK